MSLYNINNADLTIIAQIEIYDALKICDNLKRLQWSKTSGNGFSSSSATDYAFFLINVISALFWWDLQAGEDEKKPNESEQIIKSKVTANFNIDFMVPQKEARTIKK